jgi:hypothetical protein
LIGIGHPLSNAGADLRSAQSEGPSISYKPREGGPTVAMCSRMQAGQKYLCLVGVISTIGLGSAMVAEDKMNCIPGIGANRESCFFGHCSGKCACCSPGCENGKCMRRNASDVLEMDEGVAVESVCPTDDLPSDQTTWIRYCKCDVGYVGCPVTVECFFPGITRCALPRTDWHIVRNQKAGLDSGESQLCS